MQGPDMHGSPQAVFTSFKLPKPGGGQNNLEPPQQPVLPPGPVSPVTTQTSPAIPGFGSRLFPFGLGNPPLQPQSPLTTPPKVSAPLGKHNFVYPLLLRHENVEILLIHYFYF